MNMAHGTFLLLGTGASAGIPVIGCPCDICHSTDERNKRKRASALICYEGKQILIDAGPDFHQQALQYDVKKIDGLAITHTHYDHIGGLEELRIFAYVRKAAIPCLLSQISLGHLKKLFYYFFDEHTADKTVPAKFDFITLPEKRGHVDFCGLPIQYFTYSQPNMDVIGYRVGDLAYITDIKEYPETIFEDLVGCKTLIISALRFGTTKLQFSIDEAVDFAKRVNAPMTYFIHMSHEIEHSHLESLLPANIRPAYDGLEIPFTSVI
ncbi:MAG: MBL fold metallo-hydrolase [Chlamydiales bacterium]|nr:MBL fold metallo-hydrolase [Chlamydiales bacterium]